MAQPAGRPGPRPGRRRAVPSTPGLHEDMSAGDHAPGTQDRVHRASRRNVAPRQGTSRQAATKSGELHVTGAEISAYGAPGQRRHRPYLDSGSVEEVPGAGEVQRDAGRLGGARSPRRRGPSRRAATIAFTPGVDQDLRAVGEREERVGRGRPSPAARSPGPRHREAARVDPVDLAHADADRGAVARRAGSRWTSPTRQARQANARSARVASSTARPAVSVQVAGSSPGASTRSTRLHQQAAGDPAGLDARRGPVGGQTQQPDVLLARQHLHRAVLVSRARRHLGEDLRDLLGHRRRDRRGWRRSRRRTPRPGRRRAPCGAPRRRRRRPRCRTGWRA